MKKPVYQKPAVLATYTEKDKKEAFKVLTGLLAVPGASTR